MTAKTMTNRFVWVFFFLTAPAGAAPRRAPPVATELFGAAIATSSRTTVELVRVQSFDHSGKAKAQYWQRSMGPEGVRIEAAAKRHAPLALLEVINSKKRMQAWPQAGRAWIGPAVVTKEDVELTMYDLSVSTGGRVAGQATWRLDMRSKADGRVRRSWWIGKKGPRILRREDYRRNGTILRRERVIKTEQTQLGKAAFLAEVPGGLAVSTRPTIWTPIGYVPLERSWETSQIYGDGLRQIVLSATRVDVAKSSEKPYAEVRLTSKTVGFFDSEDGTRLSWRKDGVDFTLTGDVAEADLARVADSVAKTP